MNQKVRLKVNGTDHELDIPARRLLVDCIRYDIGLTGTKESCSVGVCGACAVLVDGEMYASCITLAASVDGAEITTIEGIAENGNLHPIQQAFIDHGGFQCGICTPGQVIAAKSLLEENPTPTEDEIKDYMMGNLCRCTGYYGILNSIAAAAKTMNEAVGSGGLSTSNFTAPPASTRYLACLTNTAKTAALWPEEPRWSSR